MGIVRNLKLPNTVQIPVKKNGLLRLWHWLNAVLIFSTLGIVLINFTVLNPLKTQTVLLTKLKALGITVNSDSLRQITELFSDRLWVIHAYIGFGIASLYLFRILIDFRLPKYERMFFRLSQLLQFKTVKNQLFGALFLILFYLLIFILVVTGLSMPLQHYIPGLEGNIPMLSLILKIHGTCMYFLVGFIIIHLFFVLKAELGGFPGVISNMVNGGKK